MKKYDEFSYPSFLNSCADIIGKRRDEKNKQLRQNNPRFERGDKNEYFDITGIRAELIFGYYLCTCGITFKMAPLLAEKPVSSWDFQINNLIRFEHHAFWNIDVKGLTSQKLFVNEESHNKSKDIHFYVFVQVTEIGECRSRARFWAIPWAAVNDWDIEFAGYSNAYSIELSIIMEGFRDYDGTPIVDKKT